MIKSICLRGVCVCVCFLFNSFSFFSFFLNVSLLLPALIWWKTVRLRDSRSCHFSVSLMLIKPWLSRPRGPSRLHLPLLAWVWQKKKKKNPPRACKTNSSPRTSRTCTLNKIRQLRGQRQKRKKKLTLFCRLLKLMNTRTACWVKERGCWVWALEAKLVSGARQEMASAAGDGESSSLHSQGITHALQMEERQIVASRHGGSSTRNIFNLPKSN